MIQLDEGSVFQFAVEAAPMAGVTGCAAFLLDPEDDGVTIAIDQNFFDNLDVAALFPFAPEPVAAARIVDGLSGSERFLSRFGIDVGEHQHFAGEMVLRHSGNDAARLLKIEFLHEWIPELHVPWFSVN